MDHMEPGQSASQDRRAESDTPSLDELRCLSLEEFEHLVGTNAAMLKGPPSSQTPWIPRWMQADHVKARGLRAMYPKIVKEERKMLQQFYAFEFIVYACLISQLAIASALVILSAIGGDHHIAVAILGAVTALLAGILSLVKGQGQPMRLLNYTDSLRKVREDIEFCESGLRSGVTSVTYKHVLDIWKRYTSSRDGQMKNRPDVWFSSEENAPVGQSQPSRSKDTSGRNGHV